MGEHSGLESALTRRAEATAQLFELIEVLRVLVGLAAAADGYVLTCQSLQVTDEVALDYDA